MSDWPMGKWDGEPPADPIFRLSNGIVVKRTSDGFVPVIQIPLSQISTQAEFDADVVKHRAALERHNRGREGVPAPTAHMLVQSVIVRRPQTGPVDKRGPDDFVIVPYEFLDDRPVPPEVQALRDTILN